MLFGDFTCFISLNYAILKKRVYEKTEKSDNNQVRFRKIITGYR
jgi:hypothetical protein